MKIIITLVIFLAIVTAVYATNDAQMYQSLDSDKKHGATMIDSSDNGRDCSNINNAENVTGIIDEGMNFDVADSSYLDCNDINEFDNIPELTFGCFIYLDALNQYRGMMQKEDNSNSRFGMIASGSGLGGSDDFLIQMSNTGNTYAYTDSGLIATGVWLHAVVRYNGSEAANADELKLYINGTHRPFNTIVGDIPDTTASNSAHVILGAGNGGSTFEGRVDECFFYDRALSESEILQLYNDGMGNNPYAATTPVISVINYTSEGKRIIYNSTYDARLTPPYTTSTDTTPTFFIRTDVDSYCAVTNNNADLNYTAIIKGNADANCTTASGGSTFHICTLPLSNSSIVFGNDYNFSVGCITDSGVEGQNSTSGLFTLRYPAKASYTDMYSILECPDTTHEIIIMASVFFIIIGCFIAGFYVSPMGVIGSIFLIILALSFSTCSAILALLMLATGLILIVYFTIR